MKDLKGRWALVTGASSGIGKDFASLLARLNCNLILVARRGDRLKSISSSLSAKYGVEVVHYSEDLRQDSARENIFNDILKRSLRVDILINNAGYGVKGTFLSSDWNEIKGMIDLNVYALLHLTHLFGKEMAQRGYGYILQVGSVAGFQGVPKYTTYSASKAFVYNFTEGFNFELRKKGVRTLVLCPGGTRTEFFDHAGQKLNSFQNSSLMNSFKVAEAGLKSLLNNKTYCIPGIMNRFIAFIQRFFPRSLQVRVARLIMKESDDQV